MICDVLCLTAANAIEFLSTKLFAVLEIIFCRHLECFVALSSIKAQVNI